MLGITKKFAMVIGMLAFCSGQVSASDLNSNETADGAEDSSNKLRVAPLVRNEVSVENLDQTWFGSIGYDMQKYIVLLIAVSTKNPLELSQVCKTFRDIIRPEIIISRSKPFSELSSLHKKLLIAIHGGLGQEVFYEQFLNMTVNCINEVDNDVRAQDVCLSSSPNPFKSTLPLPEFITVLVLTTDLSVFCNTNINKGKRLVCLAPFQCIKQKMQALPGLDQIIDKVDPKSYVFIDRDEEDENDLTRYEVG